MEIVPRIILSDALKKWINFHSAQEKLHLQIKKEYMTRIVNLPQVDEYSQERHNRFCYVKLET